MRNSTNVGRSGNCYGCLAVQFLLSLGGFTRAVIRRIIPVTYGGLAFTTTRDSMVCVINRSITCVSTDVR